MWWNINGPKLSISYNMISVTHGSIKAVCNCTNTFNNSIDSVDDNHVHDDGWENDGDDDIVEIAFDNQFAADAAFYVCEKKMKRSLVWYWIIQWMIVSPWAHFSSWGLLAQGTMNKCTPSTGPRFAYENSLIYTINLSIKNEDMTWFRN